MSDADGLSGPERDHGVGNIGHQQGYDITAGYAESAEKTCHPMQAREECAMG
jgi:hypothetical protein